MAGIDGLLPSQVWILTQELAHRETVCGGDRGEGISGPDSVDLRRIADDDGLPCYQLSRVRQLIIRQQTGERHAVLGGNGGQGLPRPNNMDIHGISLPYTRVTKSWAA